MSDVLNQDHALEGLLTETIDRLPLGLGLRAELIQTLRVQQISMRAQTELLTTLFDLVSAQSAQMQILQTQIDTLTDQLNKFTTQSTHRTQVIDVHSSSDGEEQPASKRVDANQVRTSSSTQAQTTDSSHERKPETLRSRSLGEFLKSRRKYR